MFPYLIRTFYIARKKTPIHNLHSEAENQCLKGTGLSDISVFYVIKKCFHVINKK